MKIKKVPFSNSQYYQRQYPKTQIYLHHTAGGGTGEDVYRFWSSSTSHIATAYVISRDGTICQGFDDKFYAYHLGIKRETFDKYNIPYQDLNQSSIGIEIVSFGWLKERLGKFYNYVGTEIPPEDVCTLNKPYRGFIHYQKYTDEQLKSVEELLKYLGNKYMIPLRYQKNMFNFNIYALKGTNGIWSHTSVRDDKFDVFPQPELIQMLNGLK